MTFRPELEDLITTAVEKLPEILDHFGIEYTEYKDRISFTCPIHESDNEESLSVFTVGNKAVGNWKCWTGACEKEMLTETINGKTVRRPRGKNVFGLLRGLLKASYNKEVSYHEAIKWASNFVKYEAREYSDEDLDKKRFINLTKDTPLTTKKTKITRDKIRFHLKIPAEYYISRGYDIKTLNRYDIGTCYDNTLKGMYNRVVVPVYEENSEYLVGYLGRTLNPKYPKWINSEGFEKEKSLYNLWFAKPYIYNSSTAILVESCGNVWRLEEAGYKNSVGLYGCSFSEYQRNMLDQLGVMNIILILDNDESGKNARQKIMEECKRYYNCKSIKLPENINDIGDLKIREVQKLLNTG